LGSERDPAVIVAAHGISVDLPKGWEGRIFRREHGDPTLHAATFALPFDDGEFGSHATARMPPGSSFLTVTEYRPGGGLVPGRGLFAAGAIPLPVSRQRFRSSHLLVARSGQRGFQHFFTASGRPFCLYAVVNEPRLSAARADVPAVNAVLESLSIKPA
jgi:hypothetical protein